MKTLIIYTSKYEFTSDAVTSLAAQLTTEVTSVNLRQQAAPVLTAFDQVIIGGSIYMGKFDKKLIKYLKKNEAELTTKQLAFFVSCGNADQYQNYLHEQIPNTLFAKAQALACFGGEFRRERMKWLDKLMVQAIQKQNPQQPEPVKLARNITALAQTMNELSK